MLELADDMAIDIPYIWLYLAELLCPVLKEGGFSMRELFSELSKPLLPVGKAGILISQILHILCKQMSHRAVASLWGESGLNWTDLLPEEEDVQAFISQQKLQFIQADASSSEATLSERIWSPENGEAEMEPMRNGAGHTSETESSDSTQKPEGLPAINAVVLDKKPEIELDQTAEEETTIQEKLDESEPVVLVEPSSSARETRQRAPSNLRKKTSGLTQTEPVVFVGAAFCKEWPKICVSFGFSEDEYSSILKEQQQQPLASKHLGPLEVVPKVLQGFWLPPEDTCLNMPSQHLSVLAVSLTKAVEDMVSKLLPSLLREVSFTRSTRDKLVQSIQDSVRQSFTHPVLMEKISCCAVDLLSMTTIATKNICELFQPQISTKEPNTVAEEVKQEPHQESAFTLPLPAPPVTPPAEPAVVLEGEDLSHVPIIPPAPVTPPAVTSEGKISAALFLLKRQS
ncbi:uncharacterized protein LOC118121844 [Hippoglossus stenolepis]|uniref:uncharacterized protein LOC118121844 n=1 Tax=Hippoglossus stenolepis TaxID=195615 RepID=UPI001FAF21CF|nr:uncharacterized protein LOC118121844 [Hippoglossus stenolepis]